MGVPQAMLIGALLSLAVTRSNPTKLTKSFFDGMGDAYANIIGIIISVGVFRFRNAVSGAGQSPDQLDA